PATAAPVASRDTVTSPRETTPRTTVSDRRDPSGAYDVTAYPPTNPFSVPLRVERERVRHIRVALPAVTAHRPQERPVRCVPQRQPVHVRHGAPRTAHHDHAAV